MGFDDEAQMWLGLAIFIKGLSVYGQFNETHLKSFELSEDNEELFRLRVLVIQFDEFVAMLANVAACGF